MKTFRLRKPGTGPNSAFEPRVSYNALTDSLLIYFHGGPEPAVNVDVEGSPLYLMTDPETGDLIGVHIQAFTRRFLPELPHFRAIDAIRWASHEQEPRTRSVRRRHRATEVVGSLVIEYGLRAA